MPEQIYVNGNTYTLGATVGAIAGTGGSTSYFFGNLNSGTTYQFIVVSYNYSGFSGYAGPVSVYTPFIEEIRPQVFLFGWDWPHASGGMYESYWSSGNTGNLITSSSDLTEGGYGWAGAGSFGLSIKGGAPDPFGGNNAFTIHAPGNAGFYNAWRAGVKNLEGGNTYTFSFWHNVTLGVTLGSFRITELPNSNTGPSFIELPVNQLLPTPTSPRQPELEQSIQYPSNPSFSGWQRFACEVYLGTQSNELSCHIFGRQNTGVTVAAGFTYYFYGPQLVKGNTTTNYVSTTTGGAASDLAFKEYYYSDYARTQLKYQIGNSPYINFAGACGISYITGLQNPYVSSISAPPTTRNLTKSIYPKYVYERLKALPPGMRALQPNVFNTDYLFLFNEDKLTYASGSARNYINDDYTFSYTNSSGYYGNPWPVTGLSAINELWTEMLTDIKNAGITVDYVFIDKEGGLFGGESDSNIPNSLVSGNAQYSQSWYGLTSWKDMYEQLGGTTVGAAYNYSYSPYPYWLAWARVAQMYDVKAMDLAFKQPFLQLFPDGIINNYDDYVSDPGVTTGAPDLNGHPLSRGLYMGNAASPVLYGGLNQIASDAIKADVWRINQNDPTILDGPYGGSTGATLGLGAWTSFIQAMQELRMAKRNSLDVPLTPWIGSVSWTTERYYLKSITWSGPEASPQEVRDYFTGVGLGGITYKVWDYGPRIGFGDAIQGYNPREHAYYTEVGGNSAYFFELVKHVMLHGTKAIGWFNPTTFIDYSAPGICLASENIDNSNFSQSLMTRYFMSGLTAHIREMKELDNTLQDVFDHIGGFTLTTADYSKLAWNAKWVASGAPGLNGTTWWWRITGSPKYITTVNGTTILSATGPGMWLGTTGPTLGVDISSSPVLSPL